MGNDRRGMVFDNLVLDLLFVFAVACYVEDQNLSIFMERDYSVIGDRAFVCNQLVVNKICLDMVF